MGDLKYWKILRVLTTNACNYKCSFCHNEGQEKYNGTNLGMLKFEEFKFVVQSLAQSGIKEIQFSGGEPFINPETLKMIVWANDYTDFELGCATNTQYFDDKIIETLSRTRVKFNIQFPSINQNKFELLTKTKLFKPLIENLNKLKNNSIEFSLNHVMISPNIEDFKQILPFLYENQIGLKLLPYINDKTLVNNNFSQFIIPFLDSISIKYKNQNNGSLKWWLKTPSNTTITIKYVDSPCFNMDYNICKNYAEIRLLPNLIIQPCLINPKYNLKIDLELCEPNKLIVRKIFQEAWENFTHC